MAWKVDKITFERTEVLENHLNSLECSGWKIYKIAFSKTGLYDQAIILATKR